MSLPYFHFVLLLPDFINNIIYKNKKEAKTIIDNNESLNAKPHITIDNYPKKPKYIYEAGLLALERPIRLLPPVSLIIDGYDVFGNKTIYARIKWDHKTSSWFNELWKIVGKHSSKPHITVARELTSQQFEILWPYFKDRKINEVFTVSKLAILERSLEPKPSKILVEFDFKGIQDTSIKFYDYYLKGKPKEYSFDTQQISLF
jgi:2'-5' RNA ligase